MSVIKSLVLHALSKLRKEPASEVFDSVMVADMERAARSQWDGAAALYAPKYPDTWEVPIDLPANTSESGMFKIDFPRPVEVCGFVFSLVPTSAGIIPTLDDILVNVTSDQERLWTQGTGGSAASGRADLYVTPGSLSILTPRVMSRKLMSENPNLGFDLRWRLDDSIPVPFCDINVRIACFARFLTPQEIELCRRLSGPDYW